MNSKYEPVPETELVEKAMEQALAGLDLTVTPPKVKDGDEAVVQVIVRVPAATRERWKEAAERNRVSMSEFIRVATDDATSVILDCHHQSRRVYPWAQICNDCGARL
jgi:hypothetical protein